MLKKTDKTTTPNLVETTCTCAEHADSPPGAPAEALSEAGVGASYSPKTVAFRLYRKISFVVLILFVVGLLGRNLINVWLDRAAVSIHAGIERVAWSKRVAKMSPPEALLTETALRLRASQKRTTAAEFTDGDVFGEDEFSIPSDGRTDEARLALFYAARHRSADATAALEKSMHLDDPKSFNAGYQSWRWIMLRDLYLQQGDYTKLAVLFDRMSHKRYYTRAPDGDDLGFHEMAKDVFRRVGWKEKADREERLVRQARLMPKHLSVENGSAYEFSQFRQSKFKYATIAFSEGQAQDAARALVELTTDRQALRAKVDRKEFLAAANMMIPIAQVEGGDWNEAAKSFPKALRLASGEISLDYDCDDVKPALYQAYAKFMDHQGNRAESEKYRKLSEGAAHAKRAGTAYGADGKRLITSVCKYDDNDLYPPELLK